MENGINEIKNEKKDSNNEIPVWFKSALLAVGIAALIIGLIIYFKG